MKRKTYNAPSLEQLNAEAEMSVICQTSGPNDQFGGTLNNIKGWGS